MEDFFPGDSYTTPDGVQQALRESLLLGSRWSPYSLFISVILKYRPLAVKGIYDERIWARSSYEMIKNLERCGAKFRIEGLDKIRSTAGPVVFIGNHMSTLETIALPGLICPIKNVTYVVKEKLSKGLVWGPIIRSRDPIIVKRKDPRVDLETVLREGAERLSRGVSVIVFPQGTRAGVFDRSAFNSLGIKLAAKAGVPVIPVALKTDFWGTSPILRGFGPIRRDKPVHIEFGDPIRVEGRGKAEHEKCVDFIEDRLRSWGGALRE